MKKRLKKRLKMGSRWIDKAIADLVQQVCDEEGTDKRSAIRDVMTDVIHVCCAHGFDPEERFLAALEVADEETQDELQADTVES